MAFILNPPQFQSACCCECLNVYHLFFIRGQGVWSSWHMLGELHGSPRVRLPGVQGGRVLAPQPLPHLRPDGGGGAGPARPGLLPPALHAGPGGRIILKKRLPTFEFLKLPVLIKSNPKHFKFLQKEFTPRSRVTRPALTPGAWARRSWETNSASSSSETCSTAGLSGEVSM